MEDLLNNPAVQSAVVPLIIVVIWIFLLRNRKPVWVGFVGILGFLATVGLVTGYEMIPLTSSRKIVLIAVFSALLGFLIDYLREHINIKPLQVLATLVVFALLALLWVLWPIITRGDAGWSMLPLFIYVAWTVAVLQLMQNNTIKLGVSLISLGLGTAIVCILAASALYGQLATPFSVAVGVWFVYYLVGISGDKLPLVLYLPAGLIPAILAAGSTVFASMTPLTLLFLGMIPVAVALPLKANLNAWIQSVIRTLYAGIPIGLAVWYLLQQSADEAYYG